MLVLVTSYSLDLVSFITVCFRVLSLCTCLVSEENLQKNIGHFRKSVKQMEIDIKNAQQDKSALPSDRFLPVMTISFTTYVKMITFLVANKAVYTRLIIMQTHTHTF